jgi:N-acetyl-gamma-glutamyl-phosphate reductase
MPTVRVAIAGATGYAGEELIRILRQHGCVQLTHLAASAKWDQPVPLGDVFPRFSKSLELPVVALDPDRLAASCDVALLSLPHGVSMDVVPCLQKSGRKVIDLAGDFRLKDPAAFARWYGTPQTHPELLPQAVYGCSELFREQIQQAWLVANPGCYATSVILACAPLLKAQLIEPEGMIVDAKSGLTGAGRKVTSELMFSEVNENVWPYKVNGHQHVPEIEQALEVVAGRPIAITFVPHVVPMDRGILSTMYLRTTGPVTWEQVHETYRRVFGQAAFVRIRPKDHWPRVRDVVGTNACDLAFTVEPAKRLLIVVAAIDNLMKGAAGQAVQNLNLMCGFPETTGLL